MTTKAEKAARSLAHDTLLADLEQGIVAERLAERMADEPQIVIDGALVYFNRIIRSLEDKP